MGNLFRLIYFLGKHMNDDIPIRQLSIESSVPNTTTHRLIEANKELFRINQKGNIKLVSLKKDDNITKNYLILAERKMTDSFLTKYPEFKLIKKNLPEGEYTLIIFGSRANETHRKKSDVDICAVNKDGKNNINFSQFEHLYDVKVNPLFFSRKEFKAMLNEEEHNLTNEILKKHIK